MAYNSRKLALFSVYSSALCAGIQFTIVFPFAPDMVRKLGRVDNRSDTGFWVGILASSIVIARAISSPIFGTLCDKWGRKPVLVIGLVSGMIFPVCFGLSYNLPMAITVRAFQGLFSPLSIVCKTLLSELCPGPEQPKAMGWLAVVIGISYVSGTILGGLLCIPSLTEFLHLSDYPFLLPNLIPSVISMFSLITAIFFLRETLNREPSLIQKSSRGNLELLKDRTVFLVQMINLIVCLLETASLEVFTLWCYANKRDGGFELNPFEIGLVLSAAFIIFLPFQKMYYDYLCTKYSLITIGKSHWLLRTIFFVLIPAASLLNHHDLSSKAVLVICYLSIQLTGFTSQTSILVLTNNSVLTNERGRVNGLSIFVGSIGKGIGPLIFANIFAITAQSDLPFPFNYAFTYELLAILTFLSYFLFLGLPESLNYEMKTEKPNDVELTKTVD